jgi:hypothetical protein
MKFYEYIANTYAHNVIASVMFRPISGETYGCSRMAHPPPPTHFVRQVTEFVSQHFQNRWIGRQGPGAWSPRSPDLTLNALPCSGTYEVPGVISKIRVPGMTC